MFLVSYLLVLFPSLYNPEYYLTHKRIEYVYWWNWPIYYDCWWILTESYKKWWYDWEKINSKTESCKKDLLRATKYDVLVNPWVHVALITKWYKNGSVTILDYVNTYHYPSYRKHWKINGTYALDKDCLLKSLHTYR